MSPKELSVYIAGPLYTSGDLTTNTRAAIDAAERLENEDTAGLIFRPFVPHVLVQTWQLVYARDHVLAQDWDDYWLRKCDCLLRLPGDSRGSDHEVAIAFELGIPVFYSHEKLLSWATRTALPTEAPPSRTYEEVMESLTK